jgi:hypothetical protein
MDLQNAGIVKRRKKIISDKTWGGRVKAGKRDRKGRRWEKGRKGLGWEKG